ncbi:hypothetical protein OTU49_008957 [Cherax quadricarinatus]|uniref:Uncharacterized protein n=1 Tax=Cherax quadricarinatus TaxID=27406 RepID=A0AAW0WNH8_CHEQU
MKSIEYTIFLQCFDDYFNSTSSLASTTHFHNDTHVRALVLHPLVNVLFPSILKLFHVSHIILEKCVYRDIQLNHQESQQYSGTLTYEFISFCDPACNSICSYIK